MNKIKTFKQNKIAISKQKKLMQNGYCYLCKQNHNIPEHFNPELCEYPLYSSPHYPYFNWVNYCKKYNFNIQTGARLYFKPLSDNTSSE